MGMIAEPYLFSSHFVTIRTSGLGDPVYIYPIGDIHRYSSFHSRGDFERFCAKTKERVERGENVYFILMGDEVEGLSRTEREQLRNIKLHSGNVVKLAGLYQNELDALAKDMSFMAGRILSKVAGNHRGIVKFEDGGWVDGEDYFIDKLNRQIPDAKVLPNGTEPVILKNSGGIAYWDLVIKAGQSNSPRTITLRFFQMHGETIGGGRTKGGSINAVIKQETIADANFYLAGHNHDQQGVPSQRLILKRRNGKAVIGNKDIWYIRTGGYRRGYIDGAETAFQDNYVAKGHFVPAVLGTPEIKIIPCDSNGLMSAKISVKVETN